MRFLTMVLCIFLSMNSIAYAEGNKISEKKIVKYLNNTIKQNYWTLYKLYSRDVDDQEGNNAVIERLNLYKATKLFTYIKKTKEGVNFYHVTPTSRNDVIPAIWKADNGADVFAFPAMKRKVGKIIKNNQVDRGDKIAVEVYFTYTASPNKYSKYYPDYNEKTTNKGHAKLTYDLFTEKLKLKKFESSEIDTTKWEADDWAEVRGGQLMLVR